MLLQKLVIPLQLHPGKRLLAAEQEDLDNLVQIVQHKEVIK